MLPGAAGASAAGLFEIARKLSTVPYIVRQSFQYVLAPLSSAQAHADRGAVGPLYHFASRVSTALVVPLAGLITFTGPDILSVYRREAHAALPLLAILCAARAVEAIVGPAGTIVEMIGHRALPLLNSLIAFLLWAALAFWLTPTMGAMGMAIAVSVAIVASTYAAAVELEISDRPVAVRPQAVPGAGDRPRRRRRDGAGRGAARRPAALRRQHDALDRDQLARLALRPHPRGPPRPRRPLPPPAAGLTVARPPPVIPPHAGISLLSCPTYPIGAKEGEVPLSRE